MLEGRKLAAIAAGSLTAMAASGFGLALGKSHTGAAMHRSGAAMHHTAMHHNAMHHGAAMAHEAGAAMPGAPTAAASTTG